MISQPQTSLVDPERISHVGELVRDDASSGLTIRNCTSYQISYKLSPIARVPMYLKPGKEAKFTWARSALRVRLEKEGGKFHRRLCVRGTYYVVYNNRNDVSIVDKSQLVMFEENEHNRHLQAWSPIKTKAKIARVPWTWKRVSSTKFDGKNLPDGGSKYKVTTTTGFINKKTSASRLTVHRSVENDVSFKGKALEIEALSITLKSSHSTTQEKQHTVEVDISIRETKETDLVIANGKCLIVWQAVIDLFGNEVGLNDVRMTDTMDQPKEDLNVDHVTAAYKVL